MRALWDVPAPAKINLFLHIVGRREDGYHLLQSVFALVDWADTLHFERRSDGQISRADLNHQAPALPEQDLVVRAARLLQQATGCTLGAHIALEKHLPMEAGMGGGSTDAASTLLALNRLWNLRLPLPQLLTLGLQLGADLPFFLGGRNAWVEGIGETLHPIDLPSARVLIVKPPTGASTPKIFQSPSLKRDTKRSIIEDFVANGSERIFGYGHNDLQPVAQTLCPDITTGLQWMQEHGLPARMTGSGSALFAKVAHDVDTSTLPPGWIARHCNILNEHPLVGWQ
ncbi:MAG TPA: 4-(cytidine 5'-diphospho)-2-C-methyl-D-erythritol kinase [Macromonas sp.]|nr:4-(cytidine 5'-diphospho)-2-C-methyl-D-erythritol kinase [Macromonas sp.]